MNSKAQINEEMKTLNYQMICFTFFTNYFRCLSVWGQKLLVQWTVSNKKISNERDKNQVLFRLLK